MNNDTAGNRLSADSSVMFEEVFKTHFKSLHIYACTIVKDETVAEEMVQNVFFKLWEKKEQIEITQTITGYLYRSVYNESLNHLRHDKVKASHRAHTVHTHKEYEDTKDPAALRELQQKINAALNELPEQCRTIFQLSRFEDLKYRMIADQLGISIKTVENQMGKALKLMRMKLVDYLPALLVLFINLKKLMS